MKAANLSPLLFDILVLGTGIGLCLYGLFVLLRSRRYRRYPTAVGVMTRLELAERKGYNRISDRLVSSYLPIMEYQYTVDGKAYTGRSFTFRKVSVNEKLAGRIRETFAPGAEVNVFYNPADPRDAVLNTSGGDISGFFLFGLICLVFGSFYMISILIW